MLVLAAPVATDFPSNFMAPALAFELIMNDGTTNDETLSQHFCDALFPLMLALFLTFATYDVLFCF